MELLTYINLGCGRRYHPEWMNIDFVASGDGVLAHNLSKGIPLPHASCNVVYHSHLLEHFPKDGAQFFLNECYRVLTEGGVIRIAVPDLESIAKNYLYALSKAAVGENEWVAHYEWMLLEMYDQTVRNISGGGMLKYLMQDVVLNEDFVLNRCGVEVQKIRDIARQKHVEFSSNGAPWVTKQLLKAREMLASVKRLPMMVRERILKHLLDDEYEALEIGRFRLSGEVHQWMYDRYSLQSLLNLCGFVEIVQRSASESYVSGWTDYNLDTEPDGSIYKPDSLYMEAVKR